MSDDEGSDKAGVLSEEYTTFWGDTHHNTYQQYVQDPPLAEILDFASTYLDFYTGAYYMQVYTEVPPKSHIAGPAEGPKGGHLSETLHSRGLNWKGIHLEGLKDLDAMSREWQEFQDATTAWNRPGQFVAFPGYEWQGDGRWGDHNVIHKAEGHPLCVADTLPELYESIGGLDAIAIPHHTAYHVGLRAPDWAACDEWISPFAEVFSIHGCSETDEEWVGLRSNSHMGPGVGGGTYQEALDRGLHLGAICSTDNWTNMPGQWGQGLMACLATELSRDSLWESFRSRRVYGVTGDRIQLEFTCNDGEMGSIQKSAPKREIRVAVRGSDAIDRIEVLRNGKVLATHCHQGTWGLPRTGARVRFKLRIEPGWGPRLGEVPHAEQRWEGSLRVEGAKMSGWEPCWVARGQEAPRLAGETARFVMVSRQEYAARPAQGATLFEFEADPGAELVLCLNGLEARDSVRAFAAQSHLLWDRDASIQLVRETTGVEPPDAMRGDVYYHLAHKAKMHKAIPESGYTAKLEITDDEPLERETHYRVRVEQRNGQRAWSSPIWVEPQSG